MRIAIPNYMKKHLDGNQDIPPGHRFGLYFDVWREDWKKEDDKFGLLNKAIALPPSCRKMAENLHLRQKAIAMQQTDLTYFAAKSISSFITGIGNEHPLENGFAFLNPYGLPYLPASSVKGVLRNAAEELALGLYGETEGWDMLSVWWLFGFECNSAILSNKSYKIDVLDEEANRRRQAYQLWINKGDYDQNALKLMQQATGKQKLSNLEFFNSLSDEIALQGAINFLDVYPQSQNLAVDILTPHHMGYFQGKNTPHDSEQPNPNLFVTIPPHAEFDFYCQCSKKRLPKNLQDNWQVLMEKAFIHAFDWLGFGAKTAVGYGQMQRNASSETEFNKEVKKETEKRILDLLSEEQKEINLLKEKLNLKIQSKLNEGMGGVFYSEIRLLINKAVDWSETDKSALFIVATECFAFMKVSSNPKVKEMLKNLK